MLHSVARLLCCLTAERGLKPDSKSRRSKKSSTTTNPLKSSMYGHGKIATAVRGLKVSALDFRGVPKNSPVDGYDRPGLWLSKGGEIIRALRSTEINFSISTGRSDKCRPAGQTIHPAVPDPSAFAWLPYIPWAPEPRSAPLRRSLPPVRG
jgi:hypothetical protein